MNNVIRISFFFVIFFSSITFANAQITAKAEFNRKNYTHLNLRSDAQVVADSLLKFAYSYINTPYKLGTCSGKSFDCSGFSSFVYKNFGYNLYRTSGDQAASNGIEVHKKDLKPGDLVFFKGRNAKQNRVGHVGIVVEADTTGVFKFIHASCKYGVTITEGEKEYYKTRFVTARRIIEEDETPVRMELSPIEGRTPSLIYSN